MRIRAISIRPFAAALAVAAMFGLLSAGHVLSPAERFAADALTRLVVMRATAPPAETPDVALVAIDPQSLRAFPAWPWPRRLYAQAIDRLEAAGAAAIGFDIDLSTPRDVADDAALAAAIERSGSVVLATFRQLQPLPGGGELEVANVPIPALAEPAAALGSVLMPVDSDGVVRRAPRRSAIGGREYETLAAAALSVASGSHGARVADERVTIDYRRSRGIPQIPMVELIEGRFDAELVRGRAVLIGATAAEFQDLWETPLAPARPGVWIQAVAYRTLAAERVGASVTQQAPRSAELAVVLAGCLAIGALAAFGPWQRLAALALLSLMALAGAAALLASRGWLFDPIAPIAAMASMHVLGLERVRDRLRGLVAQRDRSLSAIQRVGEASASPVASDPLGAALALLGDVVDASAVALLRASPEAELDGRRLDWQRRGTHPAGDTELAAKALAQRAMLVVPKRGDGSPGLCAHAPLFSGTRAVGVLVVERESTSPLEPLELRTIATVGAQIALLAENLRLVDDLRTTFDASVEAIASAVEARDGYTESHCRRLAIFSVTIAERIGLPPEEIEAIRLGALLHDVGKIGVRDEVLLKPGRLTDAERAEMQEHAACGHRIVSPIHGLREMTLACVRHHHERWDGTGYPDKLSGEQIPIGARIVAIVDVWDALSTSRPYKPAYDQQTVHEILEKSRGTFFEPALVDLFFEVLEEDGEAMLALTAGASS
jgi:HD-GYP domain-containing protein (c-di-GMP phosphodiesterase class II)/CHASE2 domain-containing sensor protein